jgi:hypothetical protein
MRIAGRHRLVDCARRSFESDFDGGQGRIQSRPEAPGAVIIAITIRAAMIRYHRGGSRQIRQKQMLEIGYVSHCLRWFRSGPSSALNITVALINNPQLNLSRRNGSNACFRRVRSLAESA